MPFIIVDPNLNYRSHEVDAIFTKAAFYCCQSTVKSASTSCHFLHLFWIMTHPLQEIVAEFDWLRQPPLFVWWDLWIPDDAWVDYLHQYSKLSRPITKLEFNRAFQNSPFYKMILSAGDGVKNDVGVYLHRKYINSQRVSFYFVSKNKDKVPQHPSCSKEWLAFFQTNRIGHDTRKRTHEQFQILH